MMNVFVLCTGRCGSVSFIKACEHITNYTCGHETKTKLIGQERLNFPENHIEADNRLSWFLGRLNEKYGKDAFYVHLIREREKTAQSFNKRWTWEGSIMKAYSRGILTDTENEPSIESCRDYYDTVNANIRLFLKDKPLKMEAQLETLKEDFLSFWHKIDAEGDLENALRQLDVQHNASRKEREKPEVRQKEPLLLRALKKAHRASVNLPEYFKKV